MSELNLEGLSLGATLLTGLVLGLKHSLETDHLLAVGTLVTSAQTRGVKGSVRRAARLGALWGLGHTLTLLLAGAAVIALKIFLRSEIPAWIDEWTARGVALMLIVLGAKAVWAAWQWQQGDGHICVHAHTATDGESEVAHAHFHRHGQHACADAQEHPANAEPSHDHSHGSFWVGMIHGLAGSASLMLLVLAAIPHPLWAWCFVALFGLGSVGGMSAVTAGYAFSLHASQRLSSVLPRLAQGLAGLASLGFGLHLLR